MNVSKQKELLEKGVILTIGDTHILMSATIVQVGPGILSQLVPYLQSISMEDLLSGNFEIDESKKGKFEPSGRVYMDEKEEVILY